MQYDESFRCRLYLQLSSEISPGAVSLKDNSFVHVQGRYELPEHAKIYVGEDGTLMVDSLVKDKLYASIDGRYQNRNADTISFNGQFKVKIAR